MSRHLAPAKINLALHVTGQRSDGYHLLDSLVCFADFGDEITVEPAQTLRLHVTGPMAANVPVGPDNLILKAAAMLGGGQGARIGLLKNLPVASGIGGGSADAAATLRGLCALWDLPLPDGADLLALGADIPVCMAGKTTRMGGIGDVLRAVSMPVLNAVLVNPNVAVPTVQVFEKLAIKDNSPMQAPPNLGTFNDWITYLAAQRNDLQNPACQLAPAINQVLAVLENINACQLSRMSGSGATCFGLFPSAAAAKQAAVCLAKDHPDWWVKATQFG